MSWTFWVDEDRGVVGETLTLANGGTVTWTRYALGTVMVEYDWRWEADARTFDNIPLIADCRLEALRFARKFADAHLESTTALVHDLAGAS